MRFLRLPSNERWLALLLLAVFTIALWFATRGWSRPILDRHEFRQVQTALSTYWIREAGYRLDYETPIFGPPWSVPLEFPVYQTIVGTLSRLLGTSLEPTGRAVSLLFFLAAMPAIYGLAGLFSLTRSRRLLVVAAVCSAPVYIFYTRTFMIESTALCFSLWFVFGTARSAIGTGWRWPAIATACGTLAALTKVTTFLIYLPPAALAFWWCARTDRADVRPLWRRLLVAGIPAAIALAIGAWWVHHSDAVKHTNPFADFLTSAELVKWNWGTLEQRTSADFWIQFWRNSSAFVLGEIALVPVVVGFVVATRARQFAALAGAACFVFATLLFSNLFHRHDYYYSANAALALFAAGLLLAVIGDDARLPAAVRQALLVVFFGAQLLIFHRGYADYLRREPVTPPGIADVLRATTPRDGVILVYGWDWNGLLPYYAQRRAVLVPGDREDDRAMLDEVLLNLPPRRIAALVVMTPTRRNSPAFIQERATRFQLSPAPIATSDAGDVYLAHDLAARAPTLLAAQSFPGVTLNLSAANEPVFAANKPVDSAAIALPIFTPRPRAGRTLYGMGPGEIDGRPVLNAHAPCELEFAPPAGSTGIEASFGLPDGAWQGGPSFTDGIGIEIFERLPSGARRILFRRTIDPLHTLTDRGRQRVELRDVGPFTGTLIFRVTNGEKDNSTNDWAYWGDIVVR